MSALILAKKYRIVATDLFMLCRRASYALSKGRPDDASEILGHAVRIAKQVDIEESIIRTTGTGCQQSES